MDTRPFQHEMRNYKRHVSTFLMSTAPPNEGPIYKRVIRITEARMLPSTQRKVRGNARKLPTVITQHSEGSPTRSVIWPRKKRPYMILIRIVMQATPTPSNWKQNITKRIQSKGLGVWKVSFQNRCRLQQRSFTQASAIQLLGDRLAATKKILQSSGCHRYRGHLCAIDLSLSTIRNL